jgi:hypothetical protein
MSTIIRRKHARRGLSAYKAAELLSGEIFYPVQGYDGYGDGQSRDVADYISDEMRNDWRDNREMLMAYWKRGDQLLSEIFPGCPPWLSDRPNPGRLPWAAEQFGG